MSESEESKRLLKILFLGNQEVGKTSIRRRYLGFSFEEEYRSTIGLDISSKDFDHPNYEVTVAF